MINGWFVVYKMTSSAKERIANARFGGGRARWPKSTGQYIEISNLDPSEHDIIEADLVYDNDWKEFDVWSRSCGSGSLELCKGGRNPFTCKPSSSALTEGYDFLGVTGAITVAELEAKEITLLILHDSHAFKENQLMAELIDSNNPLNCGVGKIDDIVNDFHNNNEKSIFFKLQDVLGEF